MRALVFAAAVLAPVVARADIAPECQGLPKPPDYDEQAQQDFLQNYPALALTFSPIHGPVPHAGGRGALGVDLGFIPPLSCKKRYVLDWTKTEDTNVSPVAPKFHASFAFPEIAGNTVIYVGAAYLPPVTVFEQRTVLMSAELGFGGAWFASVPALQIGARFHATSTKLVADIAKAFDERRDPVVDDLYVASSFGGDVLGGWSLPWGTPYVALGFTDVSTFFYIGDDGVVANNLHPYASFVFSAGLDGLAWDHFRWGIEFYGAPGGFSRPDPDVESSRAPPAYGHLYTARARLAYEF